MLKKLFSLLFSLLLCLSLLPGQASAADGPAPEDPPAVEEPRDPEDPPAAPATVLPGDNDNPPFQSGKD